MVHKFERLDQTLVKYRLVYKPIVADFVPITGETGNAL